MSTLKVDGIRSNGDSSGNDAITLADNTTCTANITNNLSNRNLIINGAMQVAQRGTSASVTGGYLTVDRYETATGGVNEAPTQAQADVTSGGAYDAGFRKCLKVTNGNQTSTDAGDNIIALRYHAEAQDIANSGWNYTSTSSYLTLSFWIKSSIAQSFQGVLVTTDGTSQIYPFETGSLTAGQWTKVTKTIPGNSNLQFDNDNQKGLTLEIIGYSGSTYANNSATINAWQAFASGISFGRASAASWYEANDATLEITGVQLEVSDYATDFEHRSYGVEKRLCMRYYQEYKNIQMAGYVPGTGSRAYGLGFNFPVEMKSAPSITLTATGSSSGQTISDGSADAYVTSLLSSGVSSQHVELSVNLNTDLTDSRVAIAYGSGYSVRETTYKFSAEL